MTVNVYTGSPTNANDVVSYLDEQLLLRTQKNLVAYQFGDQIDMPAGRGMVYTAFRWNRVPLPYAPVVEGVPPVGERMTSTSVTGVLTQWADSITLTDIMELGLFHPPFQQAINLTALQAAETLERNTFNVLISGTQVQIANNKANRAALLNTDVLTRHEINKVTSILGSIGAYKFDGSTDEDFKEDVDTAQQDASDSPSIMPHYCAIISHAVQADLRSDTTLVAAWQYSDVNRLYNYEIGELDGVRFCASNMIPTWTGVAAVGTAVAGTAGNLATGTYYVQITGQDAQNQYESLIYQVDGGTAVTGPNGSIAVTLPNTPDFTYSAFIGTTTSPGTLALSSSGPNVGTMQGQAVQLVGGSTVILTGAGIAQSPSAAPATGVTVHPTFIFGRGAYAQIRLRDVESTYLDKAEKVDPHNQTRVVGWKVLFATIIKQQEFMARIESGTTYPITF